MDELISSWMSPLEISIRIIGWIGAAMILAAFFLVARKRIAPESLVSGLLNAIGATGLAISTVYFGAYASAALNVIWAIIAVWNMIVKPSHGSNKTDANR